MSWPKLSPAGALRVVLAPTRKDAGLVVPPAACSFASYRATPKGAAELIAARLSFWSKAIPLGATRVSNLALPPTISLKGLIVVSGVGAPVVVICVGPNFTSVNGEFALLDHRSPAWSNTSAHGPWTELLPASLRTTSGTRTWRPLPIAGRWPALNSKIVVSALFAMYRLPPWSTIPSGPLNIGP